MATDKKFKFPKALGACADQLFKAREKRLALQKQVEEIAAEESALKEHLINNLPKSEASGVAGKLCRVSVVTKEVPQVKDWDALYKHVLKTKNFALLQRRLSDGVIKELWDDGKKVPGVEAFNAVTISMNKV